MVNKDIIITHINNLKKICKPLTNCYSLSVIENADDIWDYEESFLFSCNDNGINRLFFYVQDKFHLKKILSNLDSGTFYIDFITMDDNQYSKVFSGEILLAKMMRVATRDCSKILDDYTIMKYEDDSAGIVATYDDVHEINQLLWSEFDTAISHLCDDKELAGIVEKKEILIHRGNDNHIDALLQTDIKPKSFYINQVYNKGDKKNIHAIMIKRLKEYYKNGGRYVYAWVSENNIASLRFHKKYGLVHDGTWDIVYCIKR